MKNKSILPIIGIIIYIILSVVDKIIVKLPNYIYITVGIISIVIIILL